jgi:murein DD-endopeptidase MepM/ murein hydrolase activator NlpD
MIQNLAILEEGPTPTRLTGLVIELRSGAVTRQSTFFSQADLAAAAKGMLALEQAGVLERYAFVFQRSNYLPPKTRLASTETLEPGSALVIPTIPLLVPRGIDTLRIIAKGLGQGGPIETVLELPVKYYQQANTYSFPLRGAWLVVVGPGFSEPHRWAMIEEFALDIVRIGAGGKSYRGNGTALTDYFAWGAKVLAVAEGEVVAVGIGGKELAERFRKPGESGEAFLQRTMAVQDQLLSTGAPGVLGNFVVVRHSGGEYSHYAHLAENSVLVKPGEKVKRGQPLARLGHSGNSTEPHLHVTIADGPDPLHARSLPVRFSGLTTSDGPQPPVYVQTGWLVEAN